MTIRLKGTRVKATLPIGGGSTGTYPAWRDGKTVGTVYTINPTAGMSALAANTYAIDGNYMVNAWVGWALDELNSRVFVVNAGGHDQAPPHDAGNPIVKIDYTADAPAWVYVDPGTTQAALVTQSLYYADGRPCSRHTYYSPKYIGPGKMPDGKERVANFSAWAAFSTGQAGMLYPGGPDVQTCLLNSALWSAHNANGNGAVHGWEYPTVIPNVPNWTGGVPIPSQCQDPATGDVYVVGRDAADFGYYEMRKWTAASNTWSPTLVSTSSGAPVRGGQIAPCLFDRVRRQVVVLWTPGNASDTGNMRLIYIKVDPPYTCTTKDITGFPVIGGTASDNGFVHELDNDRYLVLHCDGGNNGIGGLYSINVTTAVMTRLADTLPTAGNAERMVYLPNLHCVLWLGRYQNAIEFMPTA